MTEEEKRIEESAIAYAKDNKKTIAQELTSLDRFPPDQIPVSVFMAGSPGAGKTEASQNLIKTFSPKGNLLRIDTDEIRSKFSQYTGKNSHLFQGGTSIIADKMHDYALSNRQSFVFDGTFTNLQRARENIGRSLAKGRFVQVIYVYQDPLQAWQFVKARELKDGRRVPCESFIHQYFQARENVNILKREFGNKIKVDLVVKNIDGTDFSYKENIDVIDNYILEKYNEEQLKGIILE
jgi:UDP-N-acetylglucosamine kinase